MKVTDDQLQTMLQKTQFAKPEIEPEFWFSFNNQRRLAFEIAKELVINGESVPTSIAVAKDFIDSFYKSAIKNGSWER